MTLKKGQSPTHISCVCVCGWVQNRKFRENKTKQNNESKQDFMDFNSHSI